MKKRVIVAICVLALALSGFAGSLAEAAPAGEPIRIGLITSLTGERAMVGEYARNALQIVLEEINGGEGVLGRPIEVVVEDDMGTDVGAVNAFNKLAQDDTIAAVVGPYYSTMDLAIAGEVARAQIPTMVGGSSPAIGQLDNDWLFQARSHDGIVAAAIANFGVDGLGASRVAIIYDSDASGTGQMEAAVSALAAKGMEPVTNDAYNTGEKDFTSQIVRIQQAEADVILAFGLQVEAGIITKQVRDMGLEMPIVGSTSYVSQIALDLALEASEGVYSCSDYVPTSPRPRALAFAPKYKELFGIESDFTASMVYDMTMLQVEAIKIAGSTDRTAIRDAIYQIQGFEGTSTVFSFDENGVGGTGVLLVQIQNGAPVVLDMISGR